jgi:hypothetical protein
MTSVGKDVRPKDWAGTKSSNQPPTPDQQDVSDADSQADSAIDHALEIRRLREVAK